MIRRSSALHVLSTLVLTLACSPKTERPPGATASGPAPETKVDADADADAQGSTGDATEAGADEVIEIALDEDERPFNVLAVAPIEATPVSVTWREVTGDDAAITFEYVAGGVLARIGDAHYERDDSGALVRLPDFALPEGELVGYWPADAWVIHAEPAPDAAPPATAEAPDTDPDADSPDLARVTYTLHQLASDHTWTAREIRGELRWTGEAQALRKGWNAGVLVRESTRLTRIGSLRSANKIGPRMARQIVDFFETRAGEVYSMCDRPNGVYVQRDCEDRACVQDNARRLPFGHGWSFSMQVPRQQHSASMVARVNEDGVEGVLLLHYEIGGWKLETLPRAPKGLWPDADGGLWVCTGDALWHRDGSGNWRDVGLPEGASAISAAMLPDQSELWLAASVGGRGVVFATSASLDAASETKTE